MADRGILFSAPMVRALLAGRKTQTRRLLNPQPIEVTGRGRRIYRDEDWRKSWRDGGDDDLPHAVGDRLWVREAAWIAPAGWTDSPVNPMGPHRQEVAYAADDRSGCTAAAAKDYKLRLRTSIYMPRWASRLWLTVTDVRVQRLQDISEADAIAEGLEPTEQDGARFWVDPVDFEEAWRNPCLSYRSLWDSLHTDPGTRWADNPWIYALTFTVHRGNIDA